MPGAFRTQCRWVAKCNAPEAPGWTAAVGDGGQLILVVPARDLVVVVTASLYNDPRRRTIQEIGAAVVAGLLR